MKNTCWQIEYTDYNPKEEPLREALCVVGNGYFATRGAGEESKDDRQHYPGTYLAGGYNRLKSDIAGRIIENEDLVNWPNWLPLTFKPEDGDWLALDQVKIMNYRQTLDMKIGVLEREIHIQDKDKRETIIHSRRFVHATHKHLAGIHWKLTPKNWSGIITVRSSLDGSVINNGVPRYRDLNSHHLHTQDVGAFEENGIFLKTQTTQSEVAMAQAARTEIDADYLMDGIQRETITEEDQVHQELIFSVQQNMPVNVEKIVALFTSRDKAISNPLLEAKKSAERAPRFEQLLEDQKIGWKEIWDRVDTRIGCKEDKEQKILRLHIFHLFQTVSFNTIDLDVSVPSRGWHGEAYRGHILWDELFIFPFLNLSAPELTRSLLMYRYNRLPEARYNAKINGYSGAMYPWQSGSDGREESQEIHLNPQSGNWIPDNTFLQRHVNSAIAYNIWQYFEVTNDLEFLSFYGAEMLLNIAHFWSTKAIWCQNKKRYEIRQVAGPDEYHTSYIGSEDPGINNNAYTNIMAMWVLKHALQLNDFLDSKRIDELITRLGITHKEFDRWKEITEKMFVPFIEDNKIISQFEGFELLKELDWDYYHKEYGEILRLDRILEKEGDDVNNYQAVKQADVIMLFYLFSAEELTDLLQTAGYDFNPKSIPDNIQYYQDRTSHGSTLSKVVFSWVTSRSHRKKSWSNFKKALMSDFDDIQGGTTPEGIHLGAMSGTIDLMQRCYSGLEMRGGALWFNPQIPEEIDHIAFRLRYRGHWLYVNLTNSNLYLRCDGGWSTEPVHLKVKGKDYKLNLGGEMEFKLLKNKVELIKE